MGGTSGLDLVILPSEHKRKPDMKEIYNVDEVIQYNREKQKDHEIREARGEALKNEFKANEAQLARCRDLLLTDSEDWRGSCNDEIVLESDCDFSDEFDRRCIASLMGYVLGSTESPYELNSFFVEYIESCVKGAIFATQDAAVQWVKENVSEEDSTSLDCALDDISCSSVNFKDS